jgi:uncharacterized protein (TIGR03083 family)
MWSSAERITILRAETERLEQYLKALPEAAWERPSACDRWTIADVVAHLTWPGRIYPSRILRALQGDALPDQEPAHHRLDAGQMDPAVEGDRAILLRQELGDQLLADFIKSNQAIDQALAKAGPQDWEKLVYRGVGTESLRNLVDVFITERTIHGWDIRSRFDPQARLSPECVPIIVERIPQRPRWWSFRAEAGFSPLPLRYRFAVTQPAPSVVDVVVTEAHQYLEVASQDAAQVIIRCGGETFVLLMYGRIKPEAAMAEGCVSFEGDQQLVTAFTERFTGG